MSKKRSQVYLVQFLGTMSVLGILGAIVLPSFLKQVSSCPTTELTPQDTLLSQVPLPVDRLLNRWFCEQEAKRAKAEAKQTVGSMNRAQQAYHLENSAFSSTVDNLGLGITTQTTNYSYSVRITSDAAYQYGISRKEPFKSYVGGVFLPLIIITQDVGSFAILCEAESPGRIKPADPISVNGVDRVCAPGTRVFNQIE